MSEKSPAIYILASRRNGTLYIGVTSDLDGRISEHKQDIVPGFTSKYGVHVLVHVEQFDTMEGAIRREKQLKKWPRQWKLALIESNNPAWRDLYSELSGLLDPAALPKLM
jgi:putative endonuclease